MLWLTNSDLFELILNILQCCEFLEPILLGQWFFYENVKILLLSVSYKLLTFLFFLEWIDFAYLKTRLYKKLECSI
jgi:hypothetical protein